MHCRDAYTPLPRVVTRREIVFAVASATLFRKFWPAGTGHPVEWLGWWLSFVECMQGGAGFPTPSPKPPYCPVQVGSWLLTLRCLQLLTLLPHLLQSLQEESSWWMAAVILTAN